MEQGNLFSQPGKVSLDELLSLCERAVESGWLRYLDLAIARFLARLDPHQSPEALLCSVLASYQLGCGHSCLDLDNLLKDPGACLGTQNSEQEIGYLLNSMLALLAPNRSEELLARLTQSDCVQTVTPNEFDLSQSSDDQAAQQEQEAPPLILDQNRLYLRRQWRYEIEIASKLRALATSRSEAAPHLASDLAALFPKPLESDAIDWQMLACALSVRSDLTLITGGPGTGKTTTVTRLLALLMTQAQRQGETPELLLAAPTGKAAARLFNSITQALAELPEPYRTFSVKEVSTLHRALGVARGVSTRLSYQPGSYRYHAARPLPADIVLVDEASMIDLELFHALLVALKPGARLILLGDKDQLASVEAGAILAELCRDAEQGGYDDETLDWLATEAKIDLNAWIATQGTPGQRRIDQSRVLLRRSYRFGEQSGIGALARAVNEADSERVNRILETGYDDLDCTLIDKPESLIPLIQNDRGYGRYRHSLEHAPSDKRLQQEECRDHWGRALLDAYDCFRILSPMRSGEWGVDALNRLCEHALGLNLTRESEVWYHGRPVILTENDYGLGLMNGDTGLCLNVAREEGVTELRVLFDLGAQGLRWVSPLRLGRVETAFALTVHKVQGSEFDHTLLVLPDYDSPSLTRELIYTGITRAKSRFTLALSQKSLILNAVRRRVHRSSGLYDRLG